MPDKDANKTYVERYILVANSTDSEEIKNNALYRAGTQMEVIPCTGDANLTPEQQHTVFEAAKELLS